MRVARTAAAVAVVLVTTAGCGLGAALGEGPHTAPTTAPGTVAAVGSAAPTTATPVEVQIADVPLGGAGGTDRLTVTRGRVQTGLVPPMPSWGSDCGVDNAALQYLPITIEFGGDELAGRLTVSTTAATPAGTGPIGVFFDGSTEPYCQDDPPFDLVDTFWSHGNGGRTTAYLVLQDAVTPATPQGRAEVFSTLDVRLDDLRRHASHDAPVRLSAPTVGALCPDDADAICVPLP